jgi:hypothetical protein
LHLPYATKQSSGLSPGAYPKAAHSIHGSQSYSLQIAHTVIYTSSDISILIFKNKFPKSLKTPGVVQAEKKANPDKKSTNAFLHIKSPQTPILVGYHMPVNIFFILCA